MSTLLTAVLCSLASARFGLRQEPFLSMDVEDRVTGAAITSSITEGIVRRFEGLAATRDRALGEGRQITRLAANSVRATHRGQIDEAERLLAEARDRMMTLASELQPYPSIYWAGYVQDAMKEAAEAAITLAIVANRPMPEPPELGVEDAAYLNAMAEAASELRREVLDRLRENNLSRAEYLLGTMDEIYSALVTVDFPDAITGGLRRTTDALRAVLERTRGDVTAAIRQEQLTAALAAFETKIGGQGSGIGGQGSEDAG